MKQTPAPQGVLIVITAVFTFAAGVLLARGDAIPAVAMLIVLAAAWVLAAVKSA
jgi:hypothetical protein